METNGKEKLGGSFVFSRSKESDSGVSNFIYTANICSEITVKTQVKTVKPNYSFFTVTWTSILPYIQYNAEVYIQVYSYYTALGAAIKCKKYS